jgi:two-component system response regulator RegA
VSERRLLLVDDDAVFVKVLSRALAARGFHVATALDATGALNALRAETMEFAIVDLRIGRENGLTLIPDLLAVQPSLRILLLTGYAILRNLSMPMPSSARCSTTIRTARAKTIPPTKTCRN